MLRADSFYKNNILNKKNELSIMPSDKNEATSVRQDNASLLNITCADWGTGKKNIYYISDIHLDHKIYKKFGKYGNLSKVVGYIEGIIDELLTDNNGKKICFVQSLILITGDTSHSFTINKIFYDLLSEKLPDYVDAFVVLGNHELWEYTSVKEAISAYGKLFNRLPNIHLLHNSLYASNLCESLYREPDELRELRRQRWQVFKDKTLSEKAKIKTIKGIEKQINLIDPQRNLTEEERHKNSVKTSIISQGSLQNMSTDEIRSKCFDSRIIIFGAIGYSRYDKKYNAENGMYMDAITTKDQEEQLSNETESIYKKLVKSLPKNHLLVATHMPLRNWSNTQFQEGWSYFSGHTHKNRRDIDSEYKLFEDGQIGYLGKHIKFNLAAVEGRIDYFAYCHDGIHDINEADYFRFYQLGSSKKMTSIDRRGGKKTNIKMLKNSGMYMFLLETEDQKLYLLEGGKRHNVKRQDIKYYYNNLTLLNKVVSEAVSDIRTYLEQLSTFIKQIGGDGRIHGNIVDIDFFNHIMVDIRNGSVIPYYADSISDRYEYPDLPKLLHDHRGDLYKNLLEYSSNLPITNTNNQMSTAVNYSTDATIYRDSNVMLKIQDMLDYNVIRFWNDGLVENFENNNQLDIERKLLN